jgi:hypothetical protein
LMRCIERGRHMEELAASLLWMSRLAAFLQFPSGLPSLGLQKKGIPESWFLYTFKFSEFEGMAVETQKYSVSVSQN